MTKLIILFQIRLSNTNPAPAEVAAFSIEGETAFELQTAYKKLLAQIKKEYFAYKHIKRLGVFEDKSDLLRLAGITDLPTFETD